MKLPDKEKFPCGKEERGEAGLPRLGRWVIFI